MKSIKFQLILLSLVLIVTCKSQNKSSSCCDDYTANLVARAYVMSIPLFSMQNDLMLLVDENESYFAEDGKAILCMQALGTALTKSGMELEQQREKYSATEKFGAAMPEGLEHLPGQVDASLNSYSNELFAMGTELLWLSRVLPAAASGDYTPYYTTGTIIRKGVLEEMQIFQMLCNIDPNICTYMQELIMESKPILEEHVSMLAKQLCN
jgi:hypothetical protein